MLIQWLKDGGNVGIHGEYPANIQPPELTIRIDATNSTHSRRFAQFTYLQTGC